MMYVNFDDNLIMEKAETIAKGLYRDNEKKRLEFINHMLSIYSVAREKDVLVIHSPGGWGCADINNLIDWEKSIVEGVQSSLNDFACSWTIIQFFRTGDSVWDHFKHIPEQARYVITGDIFLADVLATAIKFLTDNLPDLRVLLLGASQGAAFNNTVMKQLTAETNVYSIELGIFFFHLPRRLVTHRTLAIDSNGMVPDPVVHWNFWKALKAYIGAPFRWTRYKIAGKPVKFTYCINVPGHDYDWQYPTVRNKIMEFLQTNITHKSIIAGTERRRL